MGKIAETPLMLQYMEMKRKHPDAILLFRVGDFYETFSEDAVAASEILGITLTRRANGKAMAVELAGFPHHALDSYLPKLVRAGRRVAICEQLEDPKLTKKLVKRGITELVTPGVNTSAGALTAKENNFLAAIHPGKDFTGVALLDISTGEFLCGRTVAGDLDKLLGSYQPKELLRMRGTRDFCEKHLTLKCPVFDMDDWVYTYDAARERLLKQFDTATLKGFGVEGLPEAVIAAGSVLYYLDLTAHTQLSHITSLSRIDNRRYMHLDRFTARNLEILRPANPEGKSLLDVLDRTVTPMGGRQLRNWLAFPLLDPKAIEARLEAVDTLFKDSETRLRTSTALRPIGDIQRLCQRVSNERISPRELVQLSEGIKGMMMLKGILASTASAPLEGIAKRIPDLREISALIDKTIVNDPPASLGKGPVVAPGIDTCLDEYRSLKSNSSEALRNLADQEAAATGISSLKVQYNNVFGYYLEVRNTHKDKVPESWHRKQTLVNAERYVTDELKELEGKILNADFQIGEMERKIYTALLSEISLHIGALQTGGFAVADADCLLSFAETAADYGYVRPVVNDSEGLAITDGRHPVIERSLPPGEPYISNSVSLDCDTRQIMMITGPNMSGKSALLRQTALIVLMAQTGSFVPASKAEIGVVDKIFTRVGASDNLASGESTFMVEMTEASAIMHNMTSRSLILFDELGRGTSTYDGISIAWSIVEHIHDNGKCRPKTLFATHYHELNEMERKFPRIANFNVSVKEIKGKVVFLRKLEPGGSAHSFGIHVAKLAGMPPSIVRRAGEVLKHLEESSANPVDGSGKPIAQRAKVENISAPDACKTSIFQLDDPLLSQIRDRLLDVDTDNLTPLQSLNLLSDLQSLLRGK